MAGWCGSARSSAAAEQPHTLTELQIASVAVAGLADERISRRCEGVLRALVRWVEEDEDAGAS